jgi:CubicO group peptidase (beta-lactamase class C family)
MNVRRLIAAILALIIGSIRFASADSVDDYIKSEMGKQQIPGLSLAVIWKGKPIKVKSYGVEDVEQKSPVTLDTAYDVGSVAKPFTAAAVLMLVERGKIRLDDPVSRFFANTPAQWRGITVWHLLTNTSGIKDYTSEIPSATKLEYTQDLVFLRAVGAGLNFPPGTQFRYSQTNYVLLGMIIEAATGRPFYEFVTDQIFKPLEMMHTLPERAAKKVPSLATGYHLVDGKRAPADREKREFADAFFSSTIGDMVKWAVALDNGALLSEATRTMMWTPAPLLSPPPPRRPGLAPVPAAKPKTSLYGAGWYTEELNGHRVIGHAGSVGGYSANLTRFPDDQLTVIILMNLRDVKVFPLIRGVASRYSAALK